MKNFFTLFLLPLTMLGAVVPVPTFTLESGNLKVRMDGRKYDYMNRIEYKNKLLCIDEAGAHYGTVIYFKDAGGFVGSGHTETGHKELIESMILRVDGKIVPIKNNETYKGKVICFTKKSNLRGMEQDYTLSLENDVIDEKATMRSKDRRDIRYMYFFMHPWSTGFTHFHGRSAVGKNYDITFDSKGHFPMRDSTPVGVWFNAANSYGVVSAILPGKGQKKYTRFLWDRTTYRKDYLVDFVNSEFPANHEASYHMRTGFFDGATPADWKAKADETAKKLQSQK